jgi:hypothetical protein
MQRAVKSLSVQADWLKVDGNQYPDIACPGETIIQGDLLVAEPRPTSSTPAIICWEEHKLVIA